MILLHCRLRVAAVSTLSNPSTSVRMSRRGLQMHSPHKHIGSNLLLQTTVLSAHARGGVERGVKAGAILTIINGQIKMRDGKILGSPDGKPLVF